MACYSTPMPMLRVSLLRSTAAVLLLATLPAAAQVPFSKDPFTDVPTNHPYYEGIEYFRSVNILRGYQDGTFKPGNRINRAEMAQLITSPLFINRKGLEDCSTNALRADRPTAVVFKDVHKDIWFASPICIATKRGLVDGYPDRTFRPSEPIIAAEAAKMVINTFVSNFKADRTDDKWYQPYMERLRELKSLPKTVKSHDQIMTRGEVVEMIYRTRLNLGFQATAGADVR